MNAVVWMSLTVHHSIIGLYDERRFDAPRIPGTRPLVTVVDDGTRFGGRRLALVRAGA